HFELLIKDPDSAAEFFRAAQVLDRSDVAETQAALFRELSVVTDEAARLFRQSKDLDRSIERLRMRFTAQGKVEQTAETIRQRNDLAAEIEVLERNQQLTIVNLSEFPQYRAVAESTITLDEIQAKMRPSEAYTRIAVLGDDIFMFYADQQSATVYKPAISARKLDQQVDLIRSSISTFEN